MFKIIDRFEDNSLGLPYPVTLIESAEEEIDDVTGAAVGTVIPDQEMLAVAVAVVRVLNPVQLSGAEVRFIRRVLGMTATAFAEELTLDKATYSRWENDKQVCGEWADKQVRLIAVIKLACQVPHLSLAPSSVVGLRIRSSEHGEVPNITMRRVSVAREDPRHDAWDTVPLARAA